MLLNELFRIRFLLFFELSLLILFSVYGFFPFAIILSLFFLAAIVYSTFNTPIIAIHLLIFSILVDALVPIKTNSTGPSLLIVEAVFVILLALMIIKFLSNLDGKIEIPNLILLWLPFLIWGIVIGLLVGVDKLRVVAYWKNYLAGFFAFSLTYFAIKNKAHLISLIIGIMIWGLILSLIEIKILFDLGGFTTGIVGLFFKKNLLTVGWGRSNYLAAFFVVIIPLTIGYLFYTKSKGAKYLITFALVLMTFALILTLSRGGILALLIGMVILFSRLLKAKTFMPFLIVLLVIAVVLLLNPLTYVLIDRISSLETSGSVSTRINFYKDVWNAFLNHPITGVGFGNLGYYATFIFGPDESPAAHNIFLGAIGEVGLIGAILYFSILGTLLRNIFIGFRIEQDESIKFLRWCLISSIVGGLVHTLVEPTLDGLQFSIMFWTIAGVYLRIDKLKISNI